MENNGNKSLTVVPNEFSLRNLTLVDQSLPLVSGNSRVILLVSDYAEGGIQTSLSHLSLFNHRLPTPNQFQNENSFNPRESLFEIGDLSDEERREINEALRAVSDDQSVPGTSVGQRTTLNLGAQSYNIPK